MVDAKTLLEVLDALEDTEARALVWGLTDESWTQEQIERRIAESAPGSDPVDVLNQLLNHKLVFALDRTWPQEYRTRMSESMRLLAHLRQLFDYRFRQWQTAPALVADFRFRHEPRRFPKRDRTIADLVTHLAKQGVSDAVIDAATKIVGEGRTLSQFQVDATVRVFEAMEGRDSGVIVSAGTGSGKTLAFYLPALAYLATRRRTDGVGVLAIYPRNELLKDQLAAALDETRRLRKAGGRGLRLGTFFSPTPYKEAGDKDGPGWNKAPGGWICPFLTCRVGEGEVRCGGQLVWRFDDYASRIECLHCVKCQDVVSQDEIVLTRPAIRRRPPDLLFTTTEMLNRSLSSGENMHVFGVGPKAACTPGLILLDEVHTYEGTNGAQAAFLLRRWRRLLGKPITWVGLSATLANADRFFTDLCGLAEGAVRDVRPDIDDMEDKGREYQVVLRGDPAARTTLLSTTIQTLMLLRRVLDPKDQGIGAYGSRVFAFCDNLDTVNRLYRMYLSAEGLSPFGAPSRSDFPLAGLRMRHASLRLGPVTDWEARDDDGQQWWMPEELGFTGELLKVDRTSSQDSGVSSDADVVVTTASLEIGFDDPKVGAVVQHKAPRDIAQFLQRRGRAGRTRIQRPWTVAVLSDYGRDRIAYQDYEALLDPALPEKRLPLGNQSVRKMQAAMCLIDWAADRLDVSARDRPGNRATEMRRLFVQPPTSGPYAELRNEVVALLRDVMEGGEKRQALMRFIAASMHLSEDEVAAVCWEQPRSLLLDVVPTALRRLSSGWSAYKEGSIVPSGEQWIRDSPLPEFIPKALFSDLCLPEVAIKPQEEYDKSANTSIPVGMALNELAPGKVTLRWAVHSTRGLWVQPAADGGTLALEDGLAHHGEVLRSVPQEGGEALLVRPLITAPKVPRGDIQPTSNGRLTWQLLQEPAHTGITLHRPHTGPIADAVPNVTAYLHAGRGALRTWRYALQSTARVVHRSGLKEEVTNSFSWHGQPAAIGYEAAVDAQIVSLATPSSVAAFDLASDRPRLRQLRRDFFTDLLRRRLHALRVDPFLSRQIANTVIAAAALELSRPETNAATPSDISAWRGHVSTVLDSGAVDLDDGDDSARETNSQHQGLLDLLDSPHVSAAIAETLPLLISEPDDSWLPWLQERYVQTAAAAWQLAAQALCPEFDVDDDSIVDILTVGTTSRFILSDASIGGGGLLEALTSRLSEDPRRFDHLVVAALQPSDLEDVDRSLRRTLDLLLTDQQVAAAASNFRIAHGSRLANWQQLLAKLASFGVSLAHASVAALASRIFRPGSSAETDDLLRQCLSHWDAIEERTGFAIDHRGICNALAADPTVRSALAMAVPGGSQNDSNWANSVLLGLLWPRAEARRAASLVASNRFVDEAPLTERTLVLESLPDPAREIDVDADGWVRVLEQHITQTGRCRLVSASNNPRSLKAALHYLATTPVEMGWLHVHPRIEATTRTDGQLGLDVSLEEAPQ
ncbi:DEAD/DEAH box helicase [Actinocrinis puniceicyclus]|uniref:DEAD/DEAH box helicase n=1 Tax=Actinocrinis puniceicyclus TaxID=977794 RepID=A0A8J8BD89_9ACTN|nr:protein DpdJ [Actinocrinis puniceicyclus]MBS2963831.1 DEAD/DEAH box helicase [Actinocrinis puniceicyclus]